MNRNHLYVDVHVLQTVPPSCVNRDDIGSPKTAIYGGVRRARVSSQSWKHAIRLYFRDLYRPEELASRTKKIVRMVEKYILEKNPDLNAEKLAVEVLTSAGLALKDPKNVEKGTDALFFMSEAQAKALAEIAVQTPEKIKDKDVCKKALKASPSVDMALFGRMVASDPSLNYDAAAQVAHAISTHSVQNEFDYFTAVDDQAAEDTAGAGHLGTVEFNSSTLYRYATVNVNELKQNLGNATALAVRNFLEAFICSMPTGKQNTFANRTLPDSVYITIREDQPVNLVGAFEKPIGTDASGGHMESSQKQLVNYADKVYACFVDAPVLAWTIGEGITSLGENGKQSDVLNQVEQQLSVLIK